MPYARGRRRPPGLTNAEVFAWFIPDQTTKECWDWPSGTDQNGYGQLSLRGRTYKAHALSYEVHHGPTNSLHVLHSYDRPICVQPAHLHLGTNSDNVAEMVERGRHATGERVGSAKLTEADVLWIRQSDLTLTALAEMFDVHLSAISLILQGKNWHHLPGIQEGRGSAKGERNAHAKLTETNIRWIRAQNGLKGKEMAKILGVSQATISMIRSGKIWTHL